MPGGNQGDRVAVRVRGIRDADFEDVRDLVDQPGVVAGTLQLPYRDESFVRQRHDRHDPHLHRLVAVANDGGRERVVGLLALHLATNPRRSHSGAIGMMVHDAWRGRGVGTALMEALVDLADNWLGLDRIELQVNTDNPAGIALYEKFGFDREGTLRRYARRPGGYADVYAMARLRRE